MSEEVWRDILNYEGLYQQSSFGRTKSLVKEGVPKEKILKGRLDNAGYTKMALCRNRTTKYVRSHKLTLNTFNPPTVKMQEFITKGYICIDHIDNNKQNNRLENLQYVLTRLNNSKDKGGTLPTGVRKTGSNKYRAIIYNRNKGKKESSKTFLTVEEASNWYRDYAYRLDTEIYNQLCPIGKSKVNFKMGRTIKHLITNI